MLRIIQNRSAPGAKSYYSTADYYLEGQELNGVWRGQTAERLGLAGEVKQAEWDRLCDNLHPHTGKHLTPRTRGDRSIGYDFNFHVPKSLSLLYAMNRDDRILDAFRDAMHSTMLDIEQDMQTRVRKGGRDEDRTTSNMVWGEFVHFTARPVDGLPDPHLHGHCFVFNQTWDPVESKFKAGQFRDLVRDAGYYEAMFHSRIAYKLDQLGLPVQRTKQGWEVAGFDRKTISKFSRRTKLIEDIARERGIEDINEKSELGAKTRNRKIKSMGFRELQQEWRARLTEAELATLMRLGQQLGSGSQVRDEQAAARQGVDYATLHAFERQSVTDERKMLTYALKRSVGQARVQAVFSAAKNANLIRGKLKGRAMVTTPEVLQEERKLIAFAQKGRGRSTPFSAKPVDLSNSMLSEQQRAAVQQVLTSRDRLMIIKGKAGVGKTTLMKTAVQEIERTGTKVLAFAPSADASRGVLRDAGFADAETLAKLLVSKDLQAEAQGQLIWIDEAGLVGSKTLSQVIELADRIDARLLLSGDRYQHAAVERGSPLKLLETEAGVVPAEVSDIRRQRGELKEAVRLLSEKKTLEGFDRLNRLGLVKEVDESNRYRRMATDYVDLVSHRKTALVVSPTHNEGDRISGQIRAELRTAGLINGEDRKFTVLKAMGLTEAERSDPLNVEAGDVLQFHRNVKGVRRGARVTLKPGDRLPGEYAKYYNVFKPSEAAFAVGDRIRITHNGKTANNKHRLNNGAIYTIGGFTAEGDIKLAENGWIIDHDFGHFTHGYVVTSHASQGKSVDHVLVGQSSVSFPASSQEQFYVSVSRGAAATIYTDSKAVLRNAIEQSAERLSASEFMAQRARIAIIEPNVVHESPQRPREMINER